jgi:hypothetical protein
LGIGKIPYLSDLVVYAIRVSIIYAALFLLGRYIPVDLTVAGIFSVFAAQHLTIRIKVLMAAFFLLMNYGMIWFPQTALISLATYGILAIMLTFVTLFDLHIKLGKELKSSA